MMTPDLIEWSVEFRNGFKWPLRAGDMLRAYGTDHRELGAVPASVLLILLRHALLMANLHGVLAETVRLPPRRLTIGEPAWRHQRRTNRRARGGGRT